MVDFVGLLITFISGLAGSYRHRNRGESGAHVFKHLGAYTPTFGMALIEVVFMSVGSFMSMVIV